MLYRYRNPFPLHSLLPEAADAEYFDGEIDSLVDYVFDTLGEHGIDLTRINNLTMHRDPNRITYKSSRHGAGPPLKIPQEQRKEIIELCKDQSLTYKDIAGRFGVSSGYVSDLCRKEGIYRPRGGYSKRKKVAKRKPKVLPKATARGVRKRGKLTRQQRQEILELCNDKNLTRKMVADRYGVTPGYVSNLCVRAGQTRPRGGAHTGILVDHKPLSKHDRKSVLEHCQDGDLSYSDLATIFDVSEAEAYRMCREAGYTRARGSRRGFRPNPTEELTNNDKTVLFTIWWLRRDLKYAYYPEIKQLTQKTMSAFELSRSLRKLQDHGYIDSRNGYILYDAGQEVAWEMVQQAQEYGKLPPRLRYGD